MYASAIFRLNLTIVDCKSYTYSSKEPGAAGLNLTIVDCKYDIAEVRALGVTLS